MEARMSRCRATGRARSRCSTTTIARSRPPRSASSARARPSPTSCSTATTTIPEATLRAFSNLWYHTGDLGRRDEEGDYFFVDRKADFIRHKGRNISSFAVEATVGAHEAVAESAAHGVKTAELESEAELKIAVVLKPGHSVTAEELARFINDTAPYFFVPRYIEFLDELPHTPTGRVQKYKLRDRGVTAATWDRESAGFVVER